MLPAKFITTGKKFRYNCNFVQKLDKRNFGMIKILILAYFLLIGLDILNIVDLRTLVYSFLLGKSE